MTKKNILIRDGINIYNTNILFSKNIVKIPSWLIQDVIENDKRILIKLNDVNLAMYTTEQLKRNLRTVESKIFTGKFKQQDITFNLCQIQVDDKSANNYALKNKENNKYVKFS